MASGPSVRLRPACATPTLHLINGDGAYAAPVVVGTASRGRWAIMGVRAGTNLGTVRVGRGVARPRTPVAPSRTVNSIKAKATNGTPIGARRLGLVRSTPSGRTGPGRDYDRDGLPGVFDVDDNGNRILDNVDSTDTSAAHPHETSFSGSASTATTTDEVRLFSNLKLPMDQSLNANQGSLSTAMIDAAMQAAGTLAIPVVDTGARLDCTGLTYCSTGGTGSAYGSAFPAAFSPDSSGFGLLTAGPTGDFQLNTGATSAEIGSGDVLGEWLTDGSLVAGMLNFVFGTTPALTSYSVNGGATSTISYPATVGTTTNPITVPATGSVSVTMTYWRPQREPIPAAGESGWIDIGNLQYVADIPNGPTSGSGPGTCANTYYSTTDPNLTTSSGDGMRDAQTDRSADPANTLTFTVDLTGCLGSTTWSSGESLQVDIQARSGYGDNAAQKVVFRRA